MKKTVKPDWVKIKPSELQELIITLHKQGNTPAKIGLILRDQHGIPKAKMLGKRISQILEEAGIKIEKEIELVQKEIDILNKHSNKHKHDYTAKRSIAKKHWIINKLKK